MIRLHCCLFDRECRDNIRRLGVPVGIYFGKHRILIPFTNRTEKIFGPMDSWRARGVSHDGEQ